MNRVLIEPFCGLAAVTQSYFGLQPPCSRQGCKSGYVDAIKRALGEPKGFDYYVLADVDRGLTNAMRDLFKRPRQLGAEVEELGERGSDARECWELARREREHSSAAWWVWCAGSFRGVGNFRGEHSKRPYSDGFSPARRELARRISARPAIDHVDVICCTASSIWAHGGAAVYMDPPYWGTSEYPTKSKFDLKEIAFDWWNSGSRVVVSEARPLYWGPLVEHVDITNERLGQGRKDSIEKGEWLTILG